MRARSIVAILLSISTLMMSLISVHANAGIVATETAVSQQSITYDRDALLQLLNEEGVRQQLLDLGVQPKQVESRVNSLTGAELAQLNAQLQDLPAGEGVLSLVVFLFVVFIVTDMLCATDIFPFVNCINR